VSLGIRDVEFRYQKDFSGGAGSDAAYIDDVVFTAQ